MRRWTPAVALFALTLSGCDQESATDPALAQPLSPAQVLEMMNNGENPPPSALEQLQLGSIDLMELLAPVETDGAGVALSLAPTTFFATLGEGESAMEHKTVEIPATPPKGDVVFSLDLTGSMGGELNNAKANSVAIMNALTTALGDVEFGVLSYMDYPTYPNAITSCGYSNIYGAGFVGDYPYRLDQAVTSSTAAVASAMNGLVLGGGADGPESYVRAFYEAYADGNVGWRPGARRILVNWGDAVPHDCNYAALLGGSTSTGVDLGRDGVVGTADDLALMDVLDGMKANGITLVSLHSGGQNALWSAYAAYLGGGSTNYAILGNGTFPGGVDPATEIAALITAAVGKVSSLTLTPCDGYGAYASWITGLSPAAHTDITLPASAEFDITYTVPAGTPAGTYTFDICAIGDAAEYGRQTVTIEYSPNDPPVADAGADQTGGAVVECSADGTGGTAVTLDGSASSDPDGDALTYAWYEGTALLSTDAVASISATTGTHVYTLVVSDGEFSDTDDVTVTIEDTTAPAVQLGVDNGSLWPPNHKYVEISVAAAATDGCDGALVLSGHVVSDEADDANGNGDGGTTGDIRVVTGGGVELLSSNASPSVPFDPTTDRLWVRAERAGGGDGRTYTISFTATDASGNASTVTAEVVVPHNQ